jgi:hypothetical protein
VPPENVGHRRYCNAFCNFRTTTREEPGSWRTSQILRPTNGKFFLESVMACGIAITAAEPSGLWGLLKESFAGALRLAKAKTDPGTNALIKAVVDDFNTADGKRSA